MPKFRQFLAAVAISIAMLVDAAFAQQAGLGDPTPSFRDERRWTPRKAPDPTPPASPVIQPEISTPVPAAPVTPPPAKPAAPAAVAAPTAPAPPSAQKTTIPAPANPVVKSLASSSCGVPETKTEPLAAGRMQLALASTCRAGQEIEWTYGGAEFTAKLDAAGKLDLVIDCFAGTATPVDIKFADGTNLSLPVTARDLDRVSKVALIWRSAVDLDLHAFEYAAAVGEPGHVWAGATANLEAIRERLEKSPRGAGFLSTVTKGDGSRDKVEVYTFLHRDGHASGQIGLAVDHATRGARPAGDTCGSGVLAEVPFRLVTSGRRNPVTHTAGIIAAAACDGAIEPAARFATTALPPLRIRP